MSLTRPPLTLIQPVGLNTPNNPVKTDGSRLLVMEDTKISPDIILVAGSFDTSKGILTLVFDSGKIISISGFLTSYSIGKGEKGDSGLSGTDGIGGADGVNGVQGNRGLTGAQGLRGEKGEIGNDGVPGDRGEQGFKGDRGFSGASCGTSGGTGNTGGGTGTHDHPISEIQASGNMTALTYLRGDGTWAALPAQSPPLPHIHNLSDLVITGVATSGTYLRGDGTWATLPPQAPPINHLHPITDLQTTGVADNTTFLRGDGTWTAMSTSIGQHTHALSDISSITGLKNASTFLRGDGTWSALPAPATHQHPLTNLITSGTLSADTYLRGDGRWSNLPDMEEHTHTVDEINAIGTLDPYTYLCGDGTWSSPLLTTPYTRITEIDGYDDVIILRGGVAYLAEVEAIENYRRYGKLVTIVNTDGFVELDMSLGDTFDVTIEKNAHIEMSNMPTPPFQFLLRLKQGALGNISVIWNYRFRHPNNVAPNIGVRPNDVEMFVGSCIEAGVIEISKTEGPFNL